MTPAEQAQRLGYNHDFLTYLPLPDAPDPNARGVLVLNHETSNLKGIFASVARGEPPTAEQLEVEFLGHGMSVVEIERTKEGWRRRFGAFDRRITPSTPMALTGPAAGTERLKTAADPTGREVIGTFSNCSGGLTPWGTVLSCEENFYDHFAGKAPADHPERAAHDFYNFGEPYFHWTSLDERFDASKHPTEVNRHGWVVEVDPFRPERKPAKRTALGRMAHEVAACALDDDGRVVVYTSDDRSFEHLYRFVSARPLSKDPAENWGILDDGELSVAVFTEDEVRWAPLVHGQGALTEANGFRDQADILIEARRAADLVGATELDRPEGIAVSPTTGKVYVAFSKNDKRAADQVDAANPRGPNPYGHVVELAPPAGNHAISAHAWDILLLAGSPEKGGAYGPDHKSAGLSEHGWLENPDNLGADPSGRLWLATDSYGRAPFADGVWVTEVEGPKRGLPRRFLRVPNGGEACSPSFTPDGKTVFVAIQHPGGRVAAIAPKSLWPDFEKGGLPRPAVVAVTREDDAPVGT
jgi:secreted PhoX family phosphatase